MRFPRSLLLLLLLSPALLACTCGPRDFFSEFCLDNQEVPIVAVKLGTGKIRVPRRRHWDVPTTATTPPPITSSSAAGSPSVTVLAEVTHVYRQGSRVHVRPGKQLYLSSTLDQGMCGMGHYLDQDREFVMAFPGDGSNYASVYQCDFFVSRWYHHMVGSTDNYFKKLGREGGCEGPVSTPTFTPSPPTTSTPRSQHSWK